MHLEHFSPDEFREWWPHMSPRLLTMLDVFRHLVREPVYISKHPDSLGRHLGSSESEHNIDRWGEVLAADVFVKEVKIPIQVQRVVLLAKTVGFTGIGVYPDWINNIGERQVGFHLGVRPTKDMRHPSLWGRVGKEYVGLSQAIDSMRFT